jgi:PD-(D/E)XK nuclease superfamily
MTTPTLLGYLVRFGSFSMQAELLCTQGLAYLLQEHEDARSALAKEVEARTGVRIGNSVTWKAEALQDDKGRVDLEACTADGVPVVKIEAKLGAELTHNQLQSYLANLRKRNRNEAALLVLVPKSRTEEAVGVTAGAFELSGTGPWRVTDGHPVGIAVISWDELFAALHPGQDERFRYELEQLQAMYRGLSGGYIAPLASEEEIRQWTARATDFFNLVDQVTRKLTKHHRILPLLSEPLDTRDLPEETSEEREQMVYRLRYVCPLDNNPASCYSIGVRHSFANYVTPFWMRFHKDTGDFRSIRQRIEASSLQWLESGGHIWIPLQIWEPLEVPQEVSGEQMVQRLADQAEKIVRVAYQID